ncbi:uncharacterized protein LOC108864681 [Galendromus occidentalis]|uniref:Uncharacterized protein LOC108864681 n=1 Tax=Galendromus occidentalis TaxID=34638 RepID=A0AAJ7PAH2_9ACAR|nr:uncharacterized protein LOC108864681 [Galendromus occidentalis]
MKSNKKFECREPRCLVDGEPRVFTRAALFRQHELKVHAEKKLRCAHCPKTFSVHYLLKHHENHCNQTVKCPHCDATFRHRSSCRRHQKTAKHGVPSPPRAPNEGSRLTFNIMPLQLVPVLLVAKNSESSPTTRPHPELESKKKQTFRPIRPKSSATTPAFSSTPKESTAVQTSTECEPIPGPSIATQTVTNHCTVAVGIDEVFEDLEKLFAQAETQTHSQMSEQNFQHAETQTNQPSLADSDMQTIYDKLSDLSPIPSEPLPHVGQVEDRALSAVEVQTSFERQMQHFGMQTVFPNDSKIAGTQTPGIPSFDGQCQTGMELSSVETQTIEQFLNELENTN